jgi:hypothetical protein
LNDYGDDGPKAAVASFEPMGFIPAIHDLCSMICKEKKQFTVCFQTRIATNSVASSARIYGATATFKHKKW